MKKPSKRNFVNNLTKQHIVISYITQIIDCDQ